MEWHTVHAKVISGNYSAALTCYHGIALADSLNKLPNVARRNQCIKKNANPCNNSYLSMCIRVALLLDGGHVSRHSSHSRIKDNFPFRLNSLVKPEVASYNDVRKQQ